MFRSIVVKNLFRQRARTVLTALGIAIGIATVLALGAITTGLKATMGEFIQASGADFLVAQKGASDLSFSAVSEADVGRIARRPDVARADGLALEVTSLGSNPYFFVLGLTADGLRHQGLRIVQGRLPQEGSASELALGASASSAHGVGVGDSIVLERRPFRVVGLYRVADRLRNAGAVGLLDAVQPLSGRPDAVTAVYVTVAPGRDPEQVALAVEQAFPGLAAIHDVGDYAEVDQGVQILDAVNVAISLLAVGIGAIGVMNTMIMSVFERTREIGILRAVGWRGSRIVRMVVLESLALCLLASALGLALGVLATRAVLVVPAVSSFLAPAYGLEVFVRAVGVGVVVALVGAAYPAVRAVRLSPMEALRHE
jgi:putative ABC transport system permease protein